ncbi:UPF0282 protein [Dirofilaria immitis]
MAIVITDFTILVTIIISSLLLTTAFSNTNGTTTDILNTNITTMKNSRNELNYNQSMTRKPRTIYNLLYKSMKNYFLEFKRTISVNLKDAQPHAADETIEFQSWTLSVIAAIILTFVFICCFIPLVLCLACKLCSFCACTGFTACLQPG